MAHYKTVPMISSSINETRQDALQVTQLNVVEVLHCVPYVQVALISFSPSDVLHHDHHPHVHDHHSRTCIHNRSMPQMPLLQCLVLESFP